MKKTEIIFNNDFKYDKKNKLNRSNKIIPIELINSIEKIGITSEQLDDINIPIFKYKTQITIHGLPERQIKEKLHGYKRIVNNLNKSIGIKYNAIDLEKKRYIYKVNSITPDKYFRIDYNKSTLIKQTLIKDKYHLDQTIKEYKERISTIKINCTFYGNFNCYIAKSFIGIYAILEIDINAIYQNQIWKLLRSEERRVGKGVDLGGRRIIKKKNKTNNCSSKAK